jgi:hypothetical protein
VEQRLDEPGTDRAARPEDDRGTVADVRHEPGDATPPAARR